MPNRTVEQRRLFFSVLCANVRMEIVQIVGRQNADHKVTDGFRRTLIVRKLVTLELTT